MKMEFIVNGNLENIEFKFIRVELGWGEDDFLLSIVVDMVVLNLVYFFGYDLVINFY